MHDGPTENRLGELGSLYKYFYYYHYYYLSHNYGQPFKRFWQNHPRGPEEFRVNKRITYLKMSIPVV